MMNRFTPLLHALMLPVSASLTQSLFRISSSPKATTTRRMLEHSRPDMGQKRPTDLNALADEYLNLDYYGLWARYNSGATGRFNCTLVTDLDPTLARVAVVPQEISRVLLNLFSNAFYAVRQRSLLAEAGYQPTVRVGTRQLANWVEIRISDNGTGIPDAVKAKIFKPFFTTKPAGEGTGLGLSLSYDLVTKGYGGTLTVESVEGQGAEFTVCLQA